ncbi:MAG: hypothetical protein LBU61_02505 [Coriobacteriales bacterium]|jgi:uncharacterized protein YPO0396|nr:hypothetical protein [Coriobacteriales bacterium]
MMIAPGQHRLQRFQLINWGTFDHYIDLPVPRSGLLITGESGSGKSSLLDAMSVVLVRPSRLRLNAAAQEGGVGDSSRSLYSYVLGAYKREADASTGEPVTAYLRPAPAWSGICLTFSNGLGKTTNLIRLLHVSSTASSTKDVRSLMIIAEEPVDLLTLEPYAENGLDMRRLKAAYPAWLVSSEYSAFALRMQRCFNLENDQAQLLLHKTQSAKNLTSLDVLLRDFMLDPPDTFELADQAIEQFNELSAAHLAVVDARKQTEVLADLDTLAVRRQNYLERSQTLNDEMAGLEPFKLSLTLENTESELERLKQKLTSIEGEVARAENALTNKRAEYDSARRIVDGLGGRELEVLIKERRLTEQQLARVNADKKLYADFASKTELELPVSPSEVESFLTLVNQQLEQSQENEQKRDQRYTLAANAEQASRARDTVEQQLRTLEAQSSTLDERLLRLRTTLAEIAQVEPTRLSFAGELISVRPEATEWTGAIERVLHGLAQTLLVADDLYPLVSDYVDRNHLGQRLTYMRVPKKVPELDDPHDMRSLLYKVTVKDSEPSDWLRTDLIRRFDYLCVQTAAELRAVDRGVTIAGQIKHSQTRHEKDDRNRVNDPSRWVLGSSIEMKRKALQEELQQLRTDEKKAISERDTCENEYQKQQSLIQLLEKLSQLQWELIDDASLIEELHRLDRQIDLHKQQSSGLAEAEAQLKRAEQQAQEAETILIDLRDHRSRSQQEYDTSQSIKNSILQQLANLAPIAEAVRTNLAKRFTQTGKSEPEVANIQVRQQIEGDIQRCSDRLRENDRACTTVMVRYKTGWPALAADLLAEVDSLGEYLAVLSILKTDRLPEFESRFFDLLQKQSRNNIGELAQTISRSRREIRQRVEPINRSLQLTEYAPGKHLRLEVVEAYSSDVQQFLKDLNEISSGSLEDTMNQEPSSEQRLQAEERYQRLNKLLKRLASSETADQSWRRNCLDTRLHVKFRANVIEADTQSVDDIYTGAGGLSGGERQKLVIFCLAAALRYQLAREGSYQPSYGLVTLDEAFDKTDPAFARAGLDVFNTFGFQLLLATPLKMLQTMEGYVGGAVQISISPDHGSRCEQLIWETGDDEPLDSYAPEPRAIQESLL